MEGTIHSEHVVLPEGRKSLRKILPDRLRNGDLPRQCINHLRLICIAISDDKQLLDPIADPQAMRFVQNRTPPLSTFRRQDHRLHREILQWTRHSDMRVGRRNLDGVDPDPPVKGRRTGSPGHGHHRIILRAGECANEQADEEAARDVLHEDAQESISEVRAYQRN